MSVSRIAKYKPASPTAGVQDSLNPSTTVAPSASAVNTGLAAKLDANGASIVALINATLGNSTWQAGGGTGSVTSVAASVPSFLSIAGSPITGAGTLAITYSGTALPVVNGGTGGTTAAAARGALGVNIGSDVQAYNARLADFAGISWAQGDLPFFNGTNIVKLATGTAGQALVSGGAGANPYWATLSGGGNALTSSPLSQFAATTSAQLAGIMSDETGSGALVFANSPTLVTPNLGTPSAAVLTNATGLPLTTGVTGVLSLVNGGTGAATSAQARTNLGLSAVAASGLFSDLGSKPTTLAGYGITDARPKFVPPGTQRTAAFALADTDHEIPTKVNAATAVAVTLNNGRTSGFRAILVQAGAGPITVSGTATLHGTLSTTNQWDMLTIVQVGTDEYVCKVG